MATGRAPLVCLAVELAPLVCLAVELAPHLQPKFRPSHVYGLLILVRFVMKSVGFQSLLLRPEDSQNIKEVVVPLFSVKAQRRKDSGTVCSAILQFVGIEAHIPYNNGIIISVISPNWTKSVK